MPLTAKDLGTPLILTKTVRWEQWLHRLKLRLGVYKLKEALEEENDLDEDQMLEAVTLVTTCIDDTDAESIADFTTVYEQIEWLKGKYVGDTRAQCLSLTKELDNIKKQPGETISDLCQRVLNLQRKAAQIGQPVTETTIVMKILNSLPASYKPTVKLILGTAPDVNDMSVESIRTQLETEEQSQAEESGPKLESKALLAKRQYEQDYVPTGKECYKCGYEGHYAFK